jgi:hypothetical protein
MEEIQNYITRYKNTNNLNKAYLAFELYWLKTFDEKELYEVLYNFDNVRDERIINDIEILNKFIISLEKLLTN